jgi:hypothetical protein
MQFDKQFHDGRSPFVPNGHGDEASRYSTEISALPASSEDDAPRRSTAAAAARFMVKAAACVDDFLLSVASWVYGQALAGCADYGNAMYPGFVGAGEPVDQRDPVSGTQSEHGNPNQRLSEIPPIANDGIRGRRPFLVSRQTQSSSAADLVKIEYAERSEMALAITELRAFDDRALRDIEISRCEIEHLAGGGDRCA